MSNIKNISFEEATDLKDLSPQDHKEAISILEQEFIKTKYVTTFINYDNKKGAFISNLKPTKKQLDSLLWNPNKTQSIKTVSLENWNFYDWDDFCENQIVFPIGE